MTVNAPKLTALALTAALALGSSCSSGGGDDPKPQASAPKPSAPAPSDPAPSAQTARAASPAAQATASKAPISQEARQLYDTRCAACHGASGTGDGVAAAALNPKPRNYADAAWQATVTDAELAKVIVQGGPALGLSPLMPPNPDLQAKPEVVDDIVRLIRSFAK